MKCKEEFSDAGILDILFCILEILYYKTTPPGLLEKTFKSNTKEAKEAEVVKLKEFKINDCMGQ